MVQYPHPVREAACKKLFIQMRDEKHKLHYFLPEERPGKYNTKSGQIYPTPVCGTNRFKDSFVNYCLFNFLTWNDMTSLTVWTAMWYSMWYYATVILCFYLFLSLTFLINILSLYFIQFHVIANKLYIVIIIIYVTHLKFQKGVIIDIAELHS